MNKRRSCKSPKTKGNFHRHHPFFTTFWNCSVCWICLFCISTGTHACPFGSNRCGLYSVPARALVVRTIVSTDATFINPGMLLYRTYAARTHVCVSKCGKMNKKKKQQPVVGGPQDRYKCVYVSPLAGDQWMPTKDALSTDRAQPCVCRRGFKWSFSSPPTPRSTAGRHTCTRVLLHPCGVCRNSPYSKTDRPTPPSHEIISYAFISGGKTTSSEPVYKPHVNRAV